nr:MAG TPA: hypothetical protein [Caudoviricetes sp.]
MCRGNESKLTKHDLPYIEDRKRHVCFLKVS